MNFKLDKKIYPVLVIILLACYAAGCRTAKMPPGTANENSRHIETVPTSENKIPFPKPQSHNGGWMEFHGKVSGVNLNNPRQGKISCYTCHEKTGCIDCHADKPPKDHDNSWRIKTHGFMAGGDRERCLICHREDYCIRCHNETAPRSHRGNWREEHCSRCHFDLSVSFGAGCTVCHKQYSHLSAPHPVNENLDCTACH